MGARLHVILAQEAPLGIVIRRGPTKQVCTMLWDRRDDHFEMGQWLKGRIYERESDLSPDGRYMIYSAFDGHHHSETGGAWTAISRAPYLKALALFAGRTIDGHGGIFTGASTYGMTKGKTILRDTAVVSRDLGYDTPRYQRGRYISLYVQRLLRDGWSTADDGVDPSWSDVVVFEKPAPAGWVLRKRVCSGIARPGKGSRWDEHDLLHRETGRTLAFRDWEWADLDGDRLVWAEGGKLMAATLGEEGPVGTSELYDFNGMEFEPIEAPY